ncbi:Hpt domain-containing protein [Serratia liquefaciens]|uniref:Hpt domain-containing protein n=1 Tax=Serratia liquefaciens TaxID=614 RepID=UPI002182E346|nr:Hpt domain-containing protein [Serratia liquefaciens]CAI2413496.1 Hpt domain [Serratia liquefaciens]
MRKPNAGQNVMEDGQLSLSAHVDINRLFQVAGNDISFIKTLLYKANEENIKEIALAQTLAKQGDRVGVAKTVHRLKGSAQTICAKEIAAACLAFENRGLENMHPDKIYSGLKMIELMIFSLNDCLIHLR